jgi:DNA-binding NarL/FixJ family response regulator
VLVSEGLNPLKELTALVVSNHPYLAEMTRVVCGAFSLHRTEVITDVRAVDYAFRVVDPDVVLVGVGGADPWAPLEAMVAHRRAPSCHNPYVPFVAVSTHAERSAVLRALNLGVHEFVALPLSAKRLWLAISHAVFIGRPFIETPRYVGPDRRRRDDPLYHGPERRAGAQAKGSARADQEARMGKIMQTWQAPPADAASA